MRLEQIHLKDFRGVRDREVTFDTSGVTIVEGDNEAGKTSIAEAFRLLLEYKHGSKHRDLTKVRPVGRDVGPRVEATFTLGSRRLNYSKQWLASAGTELRIDGPLPEQLAGDAAHERALELLAAETDMNLFQSLWYSQGEELTQAAVGSSPSLLRALRADAAAIDGVAQVAVVSDVSSGSGDALLERVRAERDRYWTGTGQLPKERTQRRARLQNAAAEVEELDAQIAALEQTAARHQQLELEILWLNSEKIEIEAEVTKAQAVVANLSGLTLSAAQARAEAQLAASRWREGQRRATEREALQQRAEVAASDLARLTGEAGLEAAAHEAAKDAVDDAGLRREQAERVGVEAERKHAAARRVLDQLALRAQLTDLESRQRVVIEADAVIIAAAQTLERLAITPELLTQITAADRAVATLTERANAGAPEVSIVALQDLDVRIAGLDHALVRGQEKSSPVLSTTTIRLGQIAEVTVQPAAGTADTGAKLKDATTELERLLEQVGAESPADAAALQRQRERIAHDHETAAQRRETALAGSNSAQELATRVEAVRARVTALQVDAAADEAAFTEEQAQETVLIAAQTLEQLRAQYASAQQQLETARDALTAHSERAAVRRSDIARASAEDQRATAELMTARADVADDELAVAVQTARAESAAADEYLDSAEQALRSADADSAHAILKNALQRRDRHAATLSQTRGEMAATRALLDHDGHSGLADKRGDAAAAWEGLRQEIDAEDRRADAAELLYTSLVKNRREAYSSFATPFRERLNQYARIVFGAGVEVHIDPETLQIISRTLAGNTVVFDQLSGGAREQLAILARLAVAAIVSGDGDDDHVSGVPVVIDDALGYTDSSRLERLGAVFSEAAEHSQVIVLTCMPGRYRAIGNARTVKLR